MVTPASLPCTTPARWHRHPHEKHSLVGHKEFHGGISGFRQFGNLLNYLRSRICHNTVKGIIHHCDPVGVRLAILVNGFHQAFTLFLID